MSPNTIYKTIHQYNSNPISNDDMKKLQEIAIDYNKIKNYVYQRYGGLTGLPKLYPGYSIQNEMTKTGLRGELMMPSVYFYLAVFDAMKDIRCQWIRTKEKVLILINQNDRLTTDEKHYLRFLLRVNNIFTAVLMQESIEGKKIQDGILRKYDELAAQVDTDKMHRYLCRQVRKYHIRQHTTISDGFSISERAYRYADHGIYISTKENRKRIFVLLTDNNRYRNQLYVKLYPDKNCIEVKAAVETLVHSHEDYTNQVGITMGMFTMLVTDQGHEYGKRLGEYQIELADWVRDQTGKYNANRTANPGRKKYTAKKHRLDEQLHSYINMELNRFLKIEKPQIIYMPKLPRPKAAGNVKKINHSVTMWQRGYIKKRLVQKCMEQSVTIVEVFGKDISNECSQCGAQGNKKDGLFLCPYCNYRVNEKENTAKNAKKRGKTVHTGNLNGWLIDPFPENS